MAPPKRPIRDRILERVELNAGGCWIWKGSCFRTGYGRIHHDGKSRLTHRVAYEAWLGPIPEGMQLDHLCRNIACCKPTHLEPVTAKENVGRSGVSEAKKKHWANYTHCIHGHEYTEENTRRNKLGARLCVICQREQSIVRTKAYRARLRERQVASKTRTL